MEVLGLNINEIAASMADALAFMHQWLQDFDPWKCIAMGINVVERDALGKWSPLPARSAPK
jgi:hypothetical protein